MQIIKKIYGGVSRNAKQSAAILYSRSVELPSGQVVDLSYLRGKVVLIVNTASRCGFTRQYDDLEALYERYQSLGFEVVGFPSNDFGKQEPGSDEEIHQFCRVNHGVTFRLFPKGPVTGNHMQEVFKFLTHEGPSELQGKVRWNFEKFLIDRSGYLIGRWRSYVKPNSRSLRKAIEGALSQDQSV